MSTTWVRYRLVFANHAERFVEVDKALANKTVMIPSIGPMKFDWYECMVAGYGLRELHGDCVRIEYLGERKS